MASRTRTGAALLLPTLLCLLLALFSAPARAGLDTELRPYLERYDLPALAVAVVKKGRVIAAGAVGTRRAGEQIPVTLHDRFHIGSDTKAMTALLAAMYVEEGRLRWNSTPGELFPELAEKMDAGFRNITLEQLLSHSSGLPSDDEAFGELIARATLEADGNLDEIRYFMLSHWSTRPLAAEPGKRFAYSNMGYMVVGAMLERVAGRTWDELIVSRVFKPLGLRTAGLGPQASLGRVDAPLGHLLVDGRLKPFLAGPNGDNPPMLGPAGIAHMSVLDFARWAGWNAGEGRRGPHLVPPETLRRLHTPVISTPEKKETAPGTPMRGRYALGWGEVEMEWADGPLMSHGGSNMKNLAHIWVDRRRDLAMVLMTNVGGDKADAALRELAERLYQRYAGTPRH